MIGFDSGGYASQGSQEWCTMVNFAKFERAHHGVEYQQATALIAERSGHFLPPFFDVFKGAVDAIARSNVWPMGFWIDVQRQTRIPIPL